MSQLITGIHHVTAFAGDTQKNVDFYTGILGLRLIKKTVNFDNHQVYHLYYGNEQADTGSITFFPYPGLARGRKGQGQLTTTSFSVAADSLDYWTKRLKKFGIRYNPPQERLDETFIYFEDTDGLGLELVASSQDNRQRYSNGIIPAQHAIAGFYGVTLSVGDYEKTAGVLTGMLDHTQLAQEKSRIRYSASGRPGDFVDLLFYPNQMRGLKGSGTVHHLAFATPTFQSQETLREKVVSKGYEVTPVLDRSYFKSIYFNEPEGILFEVATLIPGFTADEDLAQLGETLRLPPWLEPERPAIESHLPPFTIDTTTYRD